MPGVLGQPISAAAQNRFDNGCSFGPSMVGIRKLAWD
jgi:hypothetical protein